MEVSRIIFKKETKEKMEKELNRLQRGKLRWEKLKEAEKEGKLNMAKTRYEVANLVGFTSGERDRGYNWVTGKIRSGQLKETIHKLGEYGRMEYEYYIVKDPDYNRKHAQESRWTSHVKTPKAGTKSLKERGREMFSRLKAIVESGEIEKAMTRTELAKMTGATRSWVCGLIERGYLKETLIDYKGSVPTYRYSLTEKEPNYDNTKFNRSAIIKEDTETIPVIETAPKENKTMIWVDESIKDTKVYRLEFLRGDVVIKLELEDYNEVIETIKTIMKGE